MSFAFFDDCHYAVIIIQPILYCKHTKNKIFEKQQIMKKIISIAGMLITTVISSTAFSQYTHKSTNPNPVRFSIATDAGLPVGALRNRYEWSTGAYGQIEIPVVSNKLAMIASTGYTRIFAKS